MQPLTVGITVIIDVIGDVVVLIVVNPGKLPIPLAARPIAVLELVQV